MINQSHLGAPARSKSSRRTASGLLALAGWLVVTISFAGISGCDGGSTPSGGEGDTKTVPKENSELLKRNRPAINGNSKS
jgi:hypothetical protein